MSLWRNKGSNGGRQSKGCSRANRRVVRVITSVRVNQRVEYDQSWSGMSLNSSHCQMHLRRGVFAFGAGISRGPCTTSDIPLLAIVNFRKRYFGSIFVRLVLLSEFLRNGGVPWVGSDCIGLTFLSNYFGSCLGVLFRSEFWSRRSWRL